MGGKKERREWWGPMCRRYEGTTPGGTRGIRQIPLREKLLAAVLGASTHLHWNRQEQTFEEEAVLRTNSSSRHIAILILNSVVNSQGETAKMNPIVWPCGEV